LYPDGPDPRKHGPKRFLRLPAPPGACQRDREPAVPRNRDPGGAARSRLPPLSPDAHRRRPRGKPDPDVERTTADTLGKPLAQRRLERPARTARSHARRYLYHRASAQPELRSLL